MRQHLLPIAAIATSTLALLCITPLPVVGTNDDVRNLAIGASIVLWFAYIAGQLTDQIQQHIGNVQAEVDEIRRHTRIEEYLKQFRKGPGFPLPEPCGDIRPVHTDIDGGAVLVGVDESAQLADVIDLRRAMTGDRAAQ